MRPLGRLAIKTLILSTVAALATLGFVAIAHEVIVGRADPIDRAIELAVHDRLGSPTLDSILAVLTDAGSWPTIVALVAAASLWAIRARRPRLALVLVVDLVVVETLNGVLKHAFERARPGMFAVVELPADYSFPSGHSMVAMAMYGALATAVIALAPRLRWPAIACATAVILMVGFSRVYLGVHWPSDVLAGFAASIPLLAVSIYAMHDFRR